MRNNQKNTNAGAFLVFFIIAGLSALLSGYLTFRVQFERHKEPLSRPSKELSYQTLRIKEQERKQVHDHFHLITEDINLEAWAKQSTCLVCHSPYPHGRNKKAKAIMNLHTEFLTCQSCHLKVEQKENIKFGWINPTKFKPIGKPYGTSLNENTGMFAETDDHYSKLAPFIKAGNKWEAITAEKGVDLAERYMKEKKQWSETKRKEVEKKLHKDTELKKFIRCSYCHAKNGIINFKQLGFDSARINQLEKMEIGGMLTNYDIFYFPDIFEKKFK